MRPQQHAPDPPPYFMDELRLAQMGKVPLPVGGAFYINLDRRVDRRAFFVAQLVRHRLPAERIPAVVHRGSWAGFRCRGAVGCLLSHRAVVTLAQKRDLPSALVFEDDATLVPGFVPRLALALKEADAARADLLYLYDSSSAPRDPRFGLVKPIRWTNMTHAYVIFARFYPRFLAEVRIDKKLDVDYLLNELPNVSRFATLAELATQIQYAGDWQGIGSSDIRHEKDLPDL